MQWVAPLASESPEFVIAVLFALKLRGSMGLGALVSSKVNQWTLLVGALPIAYAISAGGLSGLPLDDRQTGELLLTSAQSLLAALLLAYPLGYSVVTRGFGASWTINAYNIVFLSLALVLHGRPLSFLRACRQGVDTAWGLIVQFPFYAGIFGIMQNAGLGAWLGALFERAATPGSYPLLVYLYSGLMNLFVPSGGSKWLIEAPFLIPAGEELGVSVVSVMFAYAYGDSTTNLIQPMWAIPLLAVMRMRFGEIVGYTFLVALACLAVSVVAMLVMPLQL